MREGKQFNEVRIPDPPNSDATTAAWQDVGVSAPSPLRSRASRRRIQKTGIAPSSILADFNQKYWMGRVAPHSFSILHRRTRERARRCSMATA